MRFVQLEKINRNKYTKMNKAWFLPSLRLMVSSDLIWDLFLWVENLSHPHIQLYITNGQLTFSLCRKKSVDYVFPLLSCLFSQYLGACSCFQDSYYSVKFILSQLLVKGVYLVLVFAFFFLVVGTIETDTHLLTGYLHNLHVLRT